jgi:hypothetical protein
VLLRVSGDRTKNVKVQNTNTKAAKKDVEMGANAPKKAVSISKS